MLSLCQELKSAHYRDCCLPIFLPSLSSKNTKLNKAKQETLGLCMTIKNEAGNLEACLDPIINLFDETIVIDTGSTDSSVSLLRQKYGLTALSGKLQEERCLTLADLRNQGFDALQTDWILCLDADERIARKELLALRNEIQSTNTQGFLTPWVTYVGDAEIVDYKLSFFRKGFQKLGLVHDSVQPSFRMQGATAEWYETLTIYHYPTLKTMPSKHQRYRRRLACALCKDPDWLRYHWFLGYRAFHDENFSLAEQHLRHCFDNRNDFFPVESLNSAMVLIDYYSKSNRFSNAIAVLEEAVDYYSLVKSDFEVAVNFRLPTWLSAAREQLNNKQSPQALKFAY